MEKIEKRYFDSEVSLEGEKLVGYGVLFNTESRNLGGFIEKVDPASFKDVDLSEVRALRDHDPNLLLGTVQAGTLKLSIDERGVRYEIDMPNTTAGKDTLEYVKRGDLSGSSFSFAVKEHELSRRSDGIIERTIKKFHLVDDIGPVTRAAYTNTSVYTRDADAVAEEMKEIEKEVREKENPTEKDPKVEENPKPLGLTASQKLALIRVK